MEEENNLKSPPENMIEGVKLAKNAMKHMLIAKGDTGLILALTEEEINYALDGIIEQTERTFNLPKDQGGLNPVYGQTDRGGAKQGRPLAKKPS